MYKRQGEESPALRFGYLGLQSQASQGVGLGNGRAVLGGNHLNALSGVAPVSYTHLDVYKRQGLHPLIGGQFLLGAQAVVVFLLLDPVDGGLIGGRHQFILKSIDLAVCLLYTSTM